jgi:hypothetical protein
MGRESLRQGQVNYEDEGGEEEEEGTTKNTKSHEKIS